MCVLAPAKRYESARSRDDFVSSGERTDLEWLCRDLPFEIMHLPSDPAHHIDCMMLPSSIQGGILIGSMSHVHVRYHLSCRKFSMLSHAAVLSGLTQSDHCFILSFVIGRVTQILFVVTFQCCL